MFDPTMIAEFFKTQKLPTPPIAQTVEALAILEDKQDILDFMSKWKDVSNTGNRGWSLQEGDTQYTITNANKIGSYTLSKIVGIEREPMATLTIDCCIPCLVLRTFQLAQNNYNASRPIRSTTSAKRSPWADAT